MKTPHFLKSSDGKGFSLKSIIAFGSWIAVTLVFFYVSYKQGKDFKPELFYSYTLASLVGYGPKLIIAAITIIKGGTINEKDLNGNSEEKKEIKEGE